MGELIKKSDQNLPEETKHRTELVLNQEKTLYITPQTPGVDFRNLLGQVVQYVNIAEIVAEIKVGTQFVIQIPPEFQPDYDAGEMFMMRNQKTGKLWPSLVRIAENGRQEIVTPLPVVEQEFFQGNPVQKLADGHHNLLMQQQMAQLTAMVQDTYRLVERIEHGQMDDRIGRLEAGKNGLLLAVSMPEGTERTMQIDSSRQNILVAQAQIGETIKRRVEEFESVPKLSIARFAKEMWHSGYLASKTREVEEIQEYYDLYVNATKLLAASYIMTGNLKTAEETFRLGEQYMRSIDFSKVKTIGYIHSDATDMFYSAPDVFIAAERHHYMIEAKHYDYVAIEVSGETLLEVLNDGRTEEIPETEAE